jgi:hypothetical protein
MVFLIVNIQVVEVYGQIFVIASDQRERGNLISIITTTFRKLD